MSVNQLVNRLEDAKRHVTSVLNDLDEMTLPSGEKHSLALRLDNLCGDCDEVIDDLEQLAQWMTSA